MCNNSNIFNVATCIVTLFIIFNCLSKWHSSHTPGDFLPRVSKPRITLPIILDKVLKFNYSSLSCHKLVSFKHYDKCAVVTRHNNCPRTRSFQNTLCGCDNVFNLCCYDFLFMLIVSFFMITKRGEIITWFIIALYWNW